MRALRLVGLICAMLCISQNTSADMIRIKDGGALPGKVIKETEQEVVVEFGFGTMTFLPGEIEVLPGEAVVKDAEGETKEKSEESLRPIIDDAHTKPPKTEISDESEHEEKGVQSLQESMKAIAYIAVKTKRGRMSAGSGTIINKHGTMLTNHHVIKDADEIFVLLPSRVPKSRYKDYKKYGASVRKSNPYYDLAVIDIHAHTPEYLRFANEDSLEIGQEVRAIGNPQGLAISVSKGIVSSIRTNRNLGWQYVKVPGKYMGEREFEKITWIQTDAAVNPGNSGGPLLNSDNKIIGINAFGITTTGANIGLNFALHIKHVRKFAGSYAQKE